MTSSSNTPPPSLPPPAAPVASWIASPSVCVGPFLVSRPSPLLSRLIPYLDRFDDWIDQRQQSVASLRSSMIITTLIGLLAIALVSSMYMVTMVILSLIIIWTVISYLRRHTQRLTGYDPYGDAIRDVHIRVYHALLSRLPGFAMPQLWLRHARHPETISSWPQLGATIRLHGAPDIWSRQVFRLGHELVHAIIGHATLAGVTPIIDGNQNHVATTALSVPRTLWGRYHRWSWIEELLAETGSQFVTLQCAAAAKGYGTGARLNSQTLSAYLAGVHSHAAMLVNDGRSMGMEDVPAKIVEWSSQLEMNGRDMEPIQREQLAAIASIVLTELLMRPYGWTAIPFLRNVDAAARTAPSLSAYIDAWYDACPVSSLSSPLSPVVFVSSPPSSPSGGAAVSGAPLNMPVSPRMASGGIPSREAIAGARPFVSYLRELLVGSAADQHVSSPPAHAQAQSSQDTITPDDTMSPASASLLPAAARVYDEHEYDLISHSDAASPVHRSDDIKKHDDTAFVANDVEHKSAAPADNTITSPNIPSPSPSSSDLSSPSIVSSASALVSSTPSVVHDQWRCVTCDRDLADRFIIGTCPKHGCGNHDARADQCDQCGNLLNPADLVAPRCSHCQSSINRITSLSSVSSSASSIASPSELSSPVIVDTIIDHDATDDATPSPAVALSE